LKAATHNIHRANKSAGCDVRIKYINRDRLVSVVFGRSKFRTTVAYVFARGRPNGDAHSTFTQPDAWGRRHGVNGMSRIFSRFLGRVARVRETKNDRNNIIAFAARCGLYECHSGPSRETY